jgi:ketopantoate reductase
VITVAKASGIGLLDDVFDRTLSIFMGAPSTHKTSMQRDYERQGRVELEQTDLGTGESALQIGLT